MTLVTAVTTDHEDPAPGARPAGAGLARGVASVRGQRGNEDQGVYNTDHSFSEWGFEVLK